MSSSSPFGPTFRKIREARGLSLKEVAADIVSPQFLSQFERSQKGVTIETFSRLLLSMGVDWDTFLSRYPGLTIQNFSPILMKHINQENMDFLSIIERLKHEKSPVAEENKELGNRLAEKLNRASGKTVLCIPLKGVSEIDAEGKAFYGPYEDQILFETLEEKVDSSVVEIKKLNYNINDPQFADYAVDRLMEMMQTS